MRGFGSKGVALLADSEFELRHHMTARLLRRSGLSDADVFLGTASEYNLNTEIQRRDIKVLVPLGERALKQTLGESDIFRWRGRTKEYRHVPGVWVVPTLQPSKLMSRHSDGDESDLLRHPPRFHGIWMRDVHHAVQIGREGFSRLPVRYLEDPDALVFAAFADEYFAALAADPFGVWLSWDIETYYKQANTNEEELDEKELDLEGKILRISFCFRPGYAVSVPWTPTYEPTIRRLLASPGIMVTWNGRTFDVPVVEKAGYSVKGIVWDGMDAYHLLQSDLPKGLEWVSAEATDLLPWKHLAGSNSALYSAIDPDAALRNMIWLKEQLTNSGQWNLFINHVVRLMPILDAAGHRGNYTDKAVRDEIRSRLTALRDAKVEELQQYVPRDVFPRTKFERQPEGLAGDYRPSFTPVAPVALEGWDIRWEPKEQKVCTVCGQLAPNKTEHHRGSVELNPDTGKQRRVKNPCKAGTIELRPAFVPRFYRVEPFNPNSSQQLMEFMRFHRHPIGVDKRDSSKETADAGHLKKLRKQYPKFAGFYAGVLEVHKMGKTIGTYTPEADPDGFLHTQYVNSPATWRLGSRKTAFGTQIQNWGKREENKFAKEARKQIRARPGRKLVQIDSSAVEAVMQGHYMNDVDYMKTASRSIHAWLACKALGLEFTPENVDLVKEKHEALYLKMKVTNYLTNFGGGPKLMADTFPEEFPTKQAAQDTQDTLYALLPTLREFHHNVRWEAHKKTYLTTPWGYRHWYYDVFKRKPDGTLGLAKDSKRCVAFKPQNSNAAFQKDNLLLVAVSPLDGPPITDMKYLDEHWNELKANMDAGKTWAQFMPTNVSIHDSCCLDVPEALVPKATEDLLTIFTRPIPEMRNLQVGAEVEVGDNWGEMKRVAKKVIDNYTWEHTEAGIPPLAHAA